MKARPKTQAVTTEYKGATFKGFATLEEAESYLEAKKCYNDKLDLDPAGWSGLPPKNGDRKYGVANGRQIGVYELYSYCCCCNLLVPDD